MITRNSFPVFLEGKIRHAENVAASSEHIKLRASEYLMLLKLAKSTAIAYLNPNDDAAKANASLAVALRVENAMMFYELSIPVPEGKEL